MKKKILFYFFIISLFSTSSVHSQITVSPEIGISYLPFTLTPASGAFRKINSNEVNLLFGVSAQLPIHKKWNAKLRISYTDRNDVEWVEFGDFGPGSDYEWKHKDINIDLNAHYKLSKNLSIGIGPSLIRSFMELNRFPHDVERDIRYSKANKFYFAVNTSVLFEIKRINLSLMYLRTNKKKAFRIPVGDNRFDFTVGYRIGKGAVITVPSTSIL